MMLRLPLLLSIGLVFAAPVAADEGGPARPDMPLAANWSGIFAGLHAGYGRAKTDWFFPFLEYYNTAAGQGFPIKPDGAFAGGHLLLSRQYGRFVLGFEGAISKTGVSAIRLGAVTSTFPLDRFETDIDDIVTLSGRVGYAVGPWLLYAKSGWANAEVAHHALSGPPGQGVIAAVSGRRDGWAFGGGADYMLTPDISVGIQYEFMDFGADRFTTATTGTLPGQPFNLDSGDIHLHAISARLTIRLGGD